MVHTGLVAITGTFSSKPAPELTCSRYRLLCNFVFFHQEKKKSCYTLACAIRCHFRAECPVTLLQLLPVRR